MKRLLEYMSEDRIILNLKSQEKEEVFEEMAPLFVEDNIIDAEELEEFIEGLKEREKLTATGMQDGIAVPHAKSPSVHKIALALGISKEGINFESMDGEPSKYIFMIAAPKGTKQEHLDLLAMISELSYSEEVLEKLGKAQTRAEVIEILGNFEEE
jgi:hypothetical protein